MSGLDSKPTNSIDSIRLTETVLKGGCAAKLPAGQLREVLGELKLNRPPELVVGLDLMDDAALWDLKDGRYLIQTLDFFTPIVDDPFEFGAIAATNSLSDVYAMGGQPATAMTILAFPSSTLPIEILKPLMDGAISKIHESGAALVGGHTIDDETLKLGFSVSGFVAREKAWTNSGARSGDMLILTKPLGTGTITSALKSRKADESWVRSAIASMMTLNRAPELLKDISIHAATDITGFGLSGHALQMAGASRVRFEMNLQQVPTLLGAMECLNMGILNRAHRTNLEYVKDQIHFSCATDAQKWLMVDAQTSGGLLLSVAEADAAAVLNRLTPRFPSTRVIGHVRDEDNSMARITYL